MLPPSAPLKPTEVGPVTARPCFASLVDDNYLAGHGK